MTTEQVNLSMDKAALYAARLSAEAKQVSLSEWLSKVAWNQAISEAAQLSAESDRLHAEEFAGWEEDRAKWIFGEGAV